MSRASQLVLVLLILCLTLHPQPTFSNSENCSNKDPAGISQQINLLNAKSDVKNALAANRWKKLGVKGIKYSAQGFLQLTELTLNILFPFFPLLVRERGLRIILRKVLKGKELSPKELTYLKKRNLMISVSDFQKKVNEKRLFKYRKKAQALLYSWGIPLYAWILAFMAFLDEEQLNLFDYKATVALEMPENETVDLLIDYTFFPHLAMRIGQDVYSFSKTRLEKLTFSRYIQMDISELVDGKLGSVSQFELFRRTFLAIRLKLTKAEIFRLRRRYEENIGLIYRYELLSRDCSSMAFSFLREETSLDVPHFLTGSPDSTQTFLRLFDSSRVEKVMYFSQNPTPSTFEYVFYRFRNAYIGSVEAKLHLLAIPLYIYHNEIISQDGVVSTPQQIEKGD